MTDNVATRIMGAIVGESEESQRELAADRAYWKCLKNEFMTDEDREAIVYDLECTFQCARKFGRWPGSDKAILDSGNLTFIGNYAVEVIRGPWPEAEPLMAASPRWATYYALYIPPKAKRFLAGEPAILSDAIYRKRYAAAFPKAKQEWLALGLVKPLDLV